MEKTKKKFQINNVSLLITVVLFILMFAFGSVKYDNFFSISTFLNLFNDNAYLMIAGIGVTFVLIPPQSHLPAYFLHFCCKRACRLLW